MKNSAEELRNLITSVLLFYLLLQIPFNYFLSTGDRGAVVTKIMALSQLLVPPLLIIFWAWKKKLFTGDKFPFSTEWPAANWVLAPLFGLSFYFLSDSLSDIIFLLLPPPIQKQLLNEIYAVSYDFIQIKTAGDVLIFFIGFGILVPIAEELVFRGLVFTKIRETLGVNKAALYSAAFYAFLQMNPLDFLSLLGIGIVLAYLVFKTGSLLLPVASQIIYALASLIYLNIAVKNQFLDLPPWPEAIIYLILALFGLYLGVRLTDHFYEEEK